MATKNFLMPWHTYFALRIPSGETFTVAHALYVMAVCSPLVILPRELKNVRTFWSASIVMIVTMPTAVAAALGNSDDSRVYLLPFLVSLMVCSVAAVRKKRPLSPLAGRMLIVRRSGLRGYTLFLVLACVSFIAYAVLTRGAQLRLVGFDDVYELRRQARATTGPIYGYSSAIFSGAIGPIAIVYGLLRRKFPLVFLGVLGYLVIYASAGNKSALLSPALVFLVYLASRRPLKTVILPATAIIAIFMSIALDKLSSAPHLSSLVIDRIFTAPGVLTNQYLWYYDTHPQAHWGYGLIGLAAGGQSPIPGHVIGTAFYKDGVNASANFLADGFANFGFLGAISMCLVVILFIDLLDRLSAPSFGKHAMALTAPLLIGFTNTSPFTMLLTGGGLVMLLLCGVLRQNGSSFGGQENE